MFTFLGFLVGFWEPRREVTGADNSIRPVDILCGPNISLCLVSIVVCQVEQKSLNNGLKYTWRPHPKPA